MLRKLCLSLVLMLIATSVSAAGMQAGGGSHCEQNQSRYRDELKKDAAQSTTSPLDMAIVQGDAGALERSVSALNEGAARADALQNGLVTAASFGNDAAVSSLLKKGGDVNASGRKMGITPMIAAAGCGRISTMALLLEAGARWDVMPATHGKSVANNPFEAAVISNEDGSALWIADHGFDVCGIEPKDRRAKLQALADRHGMKVAARFQCPQG